MKQFYSYAIDKYGHWLSINSNRRTKKGDVLIFFKDDAGPKILYTMYYADTNEEIWTHDVPLHNLEEYFDLISNKRLTKLLYL